MKYGDHNNNNTICTISTYQCNVNEKRLPHGRIAFWVIWSHISYKFDDTGSRSKCTGAITDAGVIGTRVNEDAIARV